MEKKHKVEKWINFALLLRKRVRKQENERKSKQDVNKMHNKRQNFVLKLPNRRKTIAFFRIRGYIKTTKTIKKFSKQVGGTRWYL